jgi:hypothetical protein
MHDGNPATWKQSRQQAFQPLASGGNLRPGRPCAARYRVHRPEVRKQRGQPALDGARGELGHVGAQAIGFSQHAAALAQPCSA